tara:strand:+ start:388 stop:558 length:171 start_codon:yes stop_codon:yes gene_type:complete
MNTLKKEGIKEAKRWEKAVKDAAYMESQSKKTLMKPIEWIKVRVRTEPDSKYFVRD